MKEEATYKTLKDNMSGDKYSSYIFQTITPNKLSNKLMKQSN